jgi:glycosyltransferase involved in cell wall biosynthesis
VQVSRLDHEIKGQHILIEALKILIYELNFKNVCVDFIGDGKSKNFLEKIVKEYQLDEFVNFLGNRDRIYIYENLKNYNLLIQPSLNEGFGLTITEAMAAKIPVLVSNSGGLPEIVDEGNFGRIFKSGNFEHCANEVLNIYNAYDQVSKICNKSYMRVKKLFNLIDTSRLYQNHYKSLSNKSF